MLSCGFFNAVNGDRTYNAEQMNNPYKRIVSNGVFAKGDGTPSNDFKRIKKNINSVITNYLRGIKKCLQKKN